MNVLTELKNRGILKQISNEDKFLDLPKNSAVYAGFDPTATSLHLGNYIQIANLLRFKHYGWKVYAILGGATGMIGDPSFKDSERQLLDQKTLEINKAKIKSQLEYFGLEVIDNYDFYKDMSFLDFLREAGKMVNISYMLAKDSVASRIDKGLSFTEFSYTLIQGWDFLTLYKTKDVFVQFGGSDQWGNLTTGLDMISKVYGDSHKAVVLTSNLLTDANGQKFGKSTGGGNLWLDKNQTKPYSMYQFLVNQPDSELEKLLKQLTFLSLAKIRGILDQHEAAPQLRIAQKTLAFEVISQLHGEEEAQTCEKISNLLFNKNVNFQEYSLKDIKRIDGQIVTLNLQSGQNLVEQLIANKILKSKREAREFIQANSLKVNGEAVSEDFNLHSKLFNNQYAILNVGKKNIYCVKID
ncbi:tyrosine--tRNA ligase [Mycoplasmopsis gallopavonis]|uniref:Tyrosine--tRNA ligase n=2 Tax=Mycoplasmopsis gallopavonis TaxID=76629 RepID=A0A449AYG9_9BACT|nr:tyrosine--tRNA ligase [Mycoplasmopsis gallopavonis]RIV16739.1 tyrosine--tRNA ligase [Mycoplasmopsis gallopavonis]VEU72573.1 tyrosyl tRNA synthetase [Mycoplasmopsis gallopavonis]